MILLRLAFGNIHRLVRLLKHFLRGHRGGVVANADAELQRDARLRIDLYGVLLRRLDDAGCNLRGTLSVNAGKNRRELVTADAGDGIILPQGRFQHIRNRFQRFISSIIA